MRNFNLYIIVLTAMFANIKYSKAQSPAIDANWSLQTSLSDEFNGTVLDSKWCAIDYWSTGTYPTDASNWGNSPCNCCTAGQDRFTHNNVTVGSGELSLKIDAPTGGPPYNFNNCCGNGAIKSMNEDYSYGYLEIYAK